MEFKKKLKNLLHNKDGIQKLQKAIHISNEVGPPPMPQLSGISRDPEAEIRSITTDPAHDQATLDSIDSQFFVTEGFDPSRYELEKLPDPLNYEYINTTRKRILNELTVVSKQLLQLIHEKQSCYSGEVLRVRQVEDDLAAALFTCQESRKDLSLAKKEFTTKSLGILSNYRKRHAALTLLKSLRTINTLRQTEVRLRELLAEENYSDAIQLLVECQEAAVTYKHFTCISQLSKSLLETLEVAEEQLDAALSKVCYNFEAKQYKNLQDAYKMLGKTQTCLDQLQMHFASAINNTAFSIVYGFAELCRTEELSSNLQKKPYQDLCSSLKSDLFLPCLLDLCKAFWKILVNFRQVVLWHKQNTECSPTAEPEDSIYEDYVLQKLDSAAAHIWQDVQTKVRSYLLSFDFIGFKFEEFLEILRAVHSLREIGMEFCGSKSESLQDCIKQANLKYFQKYHEVKLEELKAFIESEAWHSCPVRPDFDLAKLHEFKFMGEGQEEPLPVQKNIPRKYFDLKTSQISPFDAKREDSEEDIYKSKVEEEEEEEEESLDCPRQNDAHIEKLGFTLTNSSLFILRLYGRYSHMLHLFESIAYDVAVCMSQLFEYYFFAVFRIFSADNGESRIESIGNAQLRLTLIRIRDRLLQTGVEIYAPNKQITCDSDEGNLFGLGQRIVASESVIYLAKQFDRLRPFIKSHIPGKDWESISQLIDQAVMVSIKLRGPIYAEVTSQALNYQKIVNDMDKVDWCVNDLMSQHSAYVDTLLKGLQAFQNRVARISAKINVPLEVHSTLWEQLFKFCSLAFVDGFSNAKKCSNGGRGLMQLDFTQFVTKLELISPISVKSLPEREYVESYVKAYYMPEAIMEDWLQKHSEYTSKQLACLVTCALQGNKKSKSRLLNLIEELEKERGKK